MGNIQKIVLTVFVLLFTFTISINAKDKKLEEILQEELNRNFEVMKNLEVPVYYISLRVGESTSHTIVANYGSIAYDSFDKDRTLAITMRIGNRKFDNMHYSGNMRNIKVVHLPITDIEEDIKLTLWRQLQQAYSEAIDQLKENETRLTTSAEEEDKSSDFSIEKSNQYYEKPIKFSELGFDKDVAKNAVRTYSTILNKNRDLFVNYATISANCERNYFIDTDGASIVQNNPSVRIMTGGVTIADDGMYMEDYKTYFGRNMKELPTQQQIEKDMKDMSKILSELKKASKVDVYNGPVLLSSDVSGVFFHEFLGHRLEGSRMKSGNDAQTLKKKIDEEVLPTRISVTLNPTINRYKGLILSGDYKYDDEGVKAQKVIAIKNGILKNFLMNRVEIEEFSHSNGHGRGNLQVGTESRQSNLIVESSNPISMEELNKRFINEIKKKGLEYGYRIDKVSGGLTMTSSTTANVFYLKPLIVYRVYADGRPDELVRGVNIVGTPMTAFSQIIGESEEQSVFNGMCGALSGYVPVSAVAPNMLIKELEFQKTGDEKRTDLPILERP